MEYDEDNEGNRVPGLNINLSEAEFCRAIQYIDETLSDELAYGEYLECLEEPIAPDVSEEELLLKQGFLYEYIADIEFRRGDYEQALATYGLARTACEALPEPQASPARRQGNLLLYYLDRPTDAIEPYEKAKAIIDADRERSGEVVSLEMYRNYFDLLSNLAIAYQAANNLEKLRDANQQIMVLGGLGPTIFGYNTLHYADSKGKRPSPTPVYREIKEAMLTKPDEVAKEDIPAKLNELVSLEKLISNDAFLPHAPEQRDHVIMLLHFKYARLQLGTDEAGNRLRAGIKIARERGFVTDEANLQFWLATHQDELDRPANERLKTLNRAFDASEKAIKTGAAVEAVCTEPILMLMLHILESKRDYIGISRIERRLNALGLELYNLSGSSATS